MKKITKRMLALLMAALCLLPALAQAKSYYTIQEVKAQAAAGWQKSYQAKGREITIDVMPQVPEVDKVTVSRCQHQDINYTIPQDDPLWRDLRVDGLGRFFIQYSPQGEEPAGALVVNGEKRSAKPWRTSYMGFSPDTAYIPGNPTTFGEITAWLQGVMASLGLDAGIIHLAEPESISTHAFYGPREGEFLAPGWASFNWPQMLHGLPIIGEFSRAFVFGRSQLSAGTRADFSLCYKGPDSFWLGVDTVAPVEILAEDIPLSGFDKVIDSLEKEIEAGRLRQVLDMKLGYYLFEAPGYTQPPQNTPYDRTRSFYALPVWRLGCQYVESAKAKVREVYVDKIDPYFYDPKNSLTYQEIMVNAQTGELIDPLKPSIKAITYPGFKTWKDIRK